MSCRYVTGMNQEMKPKKGLAAEAEQKEKDRLAAYKASLSDEEIAQLIEDTKAWLQSPERKAPKKERDYAMARLDGVIGKIRRAMQSTLEKVKSTLLRPDKKKAVTEEIKKQAKPSVLESLRKGMEEQRKKDSEKHTQEKQKKQNMEL